MHRRDRAHAFLLCAGQWGVDINLTFVVAESQMRRASLRPHFILLHPDLPATLPLTA